MQNECLSTETSKQADEVNQPAAEQPTAGNPVELEYINNMFNVISSGTDKDVSPHNIINDDALHEVVDMPVDIPVDRHDAVECKVFGLCGLNLALPLSAVKTVIKQQEILAASGEGLYAGTVNYNDENIKVIDLTALIMNEKNAIENISGAAGKSVDLILLKRSSVGIVYEQELENQVISQQDVCWRNKASERTWLTGTVKQKALSLLDLKGIHNLLNIKY